VVMFCNCVSTCLSFDRSSLTSLLGSVAVVGIVALNALFSVRLDLDIASLEFLVFVGSFGTCEPLEVIDLGEAPEDSGSTVYPSLASMVLKR